MTAPSLAMQIAILRAAGWQEPQIVRLEALRAQHRRREASPWLFVLFTRFYRYRERLAESIRRAPAGRP